MLVSINYPAMTLAGLVNGQTNGQSWIPVCQKSVVLNHPKKINHLFSLRLQKPNQTKSLQLCQDTPETPHQVLVEQLRMVV